MSDENQECPKCGCRGGHKWMCENAKAASSFAAPYGSARICEWETVSPPKTCGCPAVFVTSGKYMCQKHGEAINRRWPGAAKPLLVKHKPITQKQLEDYFVSILKECKSMTRDELVKKCVLLEHALLVANGTEIQSAPAPNEKGQR